MTFGLNYQTHASENQTRSITLTLTIVKPWLRYWYKGKSNLVVTFWQTCCQSLTSRKEATKILAEKTQAHT